MPRRGRPRAAPLAAAAGGWRRRRRGAAAPASASPAAAAARPPAPGAARCAMDFKLKGNQGAVMVSSVQSSSLNGSLTLPERYALDETSIFSPVTAIASTLTEQILKQMVVSVTQAGNTTGLDFLHRIFLKYSTTPRTGPLPPCHRTWRAKNDPSCNQHQGLSLYH